MVSSKVGKKIGPRRLCLEHVLSVHCLDQERDVPERDDKMVGWLGLIAKPDPAQESQGRLPRQEGVQSTMWVAKNWAWDNSQWRKGGTQGRQRKQIPNSEGWAGKVPEAGQGLANPGRESQGGR